MRAGDVCSRRAPRRGLEGGAGLSCLAGASQEAPLSMACIKSAAAGRPVPHLRVWPRLGQQVERGGARQAALQHVGALAQLRQAGGLGGGLAPRLAVGSVLLKLLARGLLLCRSASVAGRGPGEERAQGGSRSSARQP